MSVINKLSLILALFLAACGTTTFSPEFYAASWHSREATLAGHKYNDFNPGIGFSATRPINEHWRGGIRVATYKNSIDRQSTYGAGLVDYCRGDEYHACLGVMAGAVSGYNASLKPLAAPVVEFGYERMSVDLTTFPIANGHGIAVSGWLRYKAFEF